MELPRAYIEQTLHLLRPLCAMSGTMPAKLVHSALGKAARIGYICPDATPYVSSMWAAYTAARRSAEEFKPGTSKHCLPIRRFSVAASWICTMLQEAVNREKFGASALVRLMSADENKLDAPDLPVISFDASPWGGGAIVWVKGKAVKHTFFTWSPLTLSVLKCIVGDSDGQTSFDFFTLFLSAVTFSKVLETTGAIIKGDNLGALNVSLGLRSTSPKMNCIAREIAWRKIVLRWQYRLQHLPAELNEEADALSRLRAIPRKPFPKECLQGSAFVNPPAQDEELWKARLKG
jgi:hypothetical protein